MAQRGRIYRKGRSWILAYAVKIEGKWAFRSRKIAPYDEQFPSKESVQHLADRILQPLNKLNKARSWPQPISKKPVPFQTSIFIYALVSSRDNGQLPWYVGQSVDVGRRLIHHRLENARRKGSWIKEETASGFVVSTRIIEECNDQDAADEREAYWIFELQKINPQLTNTRLVTNGQRLAYLAKIHAKHRAQLEEDRGWFADVIVGQAAPRRRCLRT